VRFGTYHTFQCPPWTTPDAVFANELERVELSEALGFDSVWVPEQHFFPYCLCGDALQMSAHIAARTRRVQIGAGIVNLTYTHPLRFIERVAMLDRFSGGRATVAVGRGYQWPQHAAFGVDGARTRELFDEALDVALKAWEPRPFAHDGERFQIPEVQVWPTPNRRPHELLMHAVASPESRDAAIRRNLPPLISRTFERFDEEAAWFDTFRERLTALQHPDPQDMLRRTTSMRYAFLAPSKAEAQEISRKPWEWDFQMLQMLTTPLGSPMSRAEMEERAKSGWREVYEYEDWAENRFLFDDPQGCIEKIAVLRDAGVENLVLWMGIGGVDHEHVMRSMRLFAEEVAPKFR
jgi:alkanesulfonate monooxygenase SsuD/methylene tetrahydromethanopterin reductase-like flavin-dependent oxidoreductase (luciferase family)